MFRKPNIRTSVVFRGWSPERLVEAFPGEQRQGALPHQVAAAGHGRHPDVHLGSASRGSVLQDPGTQREAALLQLIDGLQSSQGLPHSHQTWSGKKWTRSNGHFHSIHPFSSVYPGVPRPDEIYNPSSGF